jgi:hypothetical protein
VLFGSRFIFDATVSVLSCLPSVDLTVARTTLSEVFYTHRLTPRLLFFVNSVPAGYGCVFCKYQPKTLTDVPIDLPLSQQR